MTGEFAGGGRVAVHDRRPTFLVAAESGRRLQPILALESTHHSMDARTLSPARDTAGATVTRLVPAAS